jgi:hypothetical protein
MTATSGLDGMGAQYIAGVHWRLASERLIRVIADRAIAAMGLLHCAFRHCDIHQ